jgi:cytochrome c5
MTAHTGTIFATYFRFSCLTGLTMTTSNCCNLSLRAQIILITLAVLGGFFALLILSPTRTMPTSDNDEAMARVARLQPVGQINLQIQAKATGPLSGEQVFKGRCSACHATGAAGAPKFGDAAAWAPRIATGFEALLKSALKGKNGMPAQGGHDMSDDDIARGVVYMANAGGARFSEPKATK